MTGKSRALDVRFLVEAAAAVLSGFLGLLTLFWHDWLEAFGWEPDGGNGLVEWFIALGLLTVAISSAIAARIHFRRAGTQRA